MMTSATSRRSLLALAAAAALAIAPAGAQDDPATQPPPADAPATAEAPQAEPAGSSLPSGQDVAQGVFVRDSAIAVDQFALAERMEGLRDWTKAADVYQDVITRFGDRLIADRSDADGKVYQYASVGRAVQRRLAAWPPEGRTVYEQKFGAAARAMLEQAKGASPPDAEQLQKVVRLYFITEAGRDAAMLLIDRHLADGSFAAARRLSRELLEMHPAATEHRPRALLRALIAAHFLGDAALAEQYAQQIAQEFAQSKETIAGEEQSIADVARDVLATKLAGAADPGGGGWPTFAGSDDRARLAPPLSSQIAPYVQDIRVPESSFGDRPINAGFRKDLENDRVMGKLTGIFPVAHDGALFWSDNIHIFAVALDSGLPLPGWLDTYGGGSSDGLAGYTLPGGGFTTPRGIAITPTVTDDFVVANMGLRDERLFAGNQPAIAPAHMVCLERETGRPVWSRTPAELDATLLSDPALQADLGECQFVGAPIAIGQTVWSLAKTDIGRGRPFEQCFVVSLDIATGNTRTITYLTSSSGGDPGARWGQRTVQPEPTSIMAYSDGLIYAPTDTGALAAVRVADGGVEWLNLYPRIPIDPIARRLGSSRLRMRSQTESQPFHAAPVIVDGGRIFFKPPDASHAFIWNAAEGDEVARIDLTGLDGDRTLLKVLGERLITFGSQGASCLDWAQVRDGREPIKAIQWASRIASKQDTAEDSILGRPAVTQTQLFLPTPEHLRVVQLSDGRVVATYPTGGATWTQSEEPGNVIVLQDQLVIAGPSRLNIYADSGVIRERLQQQVADNPGDPVPLLRLAQIGFVTGDFDATVERLRQAEQSATAGGTQPGTQGAVFASALGFAQTLSDRLGNTLAPGSPTPETVDRFFTLAEKFAHSPGQNVRVRFARADFARRQGGPDRGVALLQEILSQPQWRNVPVVPESRDAAAPGGESFTPRQAGEVARELLAEVIAGAGPQVYEPIERRAAAEVADATSAGDVEALQRLSEIYPNSAAAQSALAEAARLLQAQNRPREAASALRRLSARSEDPLAAWLTLAQIEATRPGRLEAAAGRFRRAARIAPDAAAPALSLPDRQAVDASTIDQAAFRLTEATLAAETERLPDLRLPSDPMQPLFQEQAVAVAGVEALLLPVEGFERFDRFVVRRTDGTLAAYPFAADEPVWAVAIEPSAAESIAWLPQGLLVWGDAAVALLDAQSGAVKWRHVAEALAPPPVSDQRGSERAVVATGWRPQLSEIDTAESQSPAELELQLRAMEQGRGRNRWRREEQLRNLDRLERIAQQRRANADEQDGRSDTYAVNIAGVVPSAGNIAVILSGTSNSLAGVVADDGEVPWRAPLPDGEVAAACGAGDFVAIQTVSSRSLLSAMDLDTGALVTRRGFELAGAEPLVNFIVTPENELVYVTRQQLIGVDLERQPQGTRFTVRHDTLGENPLAFGASAGAAGRLRVVGDKLLVLIDPHRASADQGARRDALVIDLAEGRPQTFNDAATGATVMVILTAAEGGAQDPEADALPPRLRQQQRMRLLQAQREAARLVDQGQAPGERMWSSGTSVYVTSDRGLSAYDLAVPGRHWSRLNAPMMREFDPAMNLGLAIGRDDLLLFDQPLPTQRRQIDQPTVRVTAFSRDRLKDGRESGQQRHEVELKAGAFGLEGQVSGFAAGEGGIAVLSSAGKLLFLRGGDME